MRINAHSVRIMLARREMTSAELASKAGLCKQAISTIMTRGTCEPKTLGKIARALEVDVEDLIAKEA